MTSPFLFKFKNQKLWLCAERCIYWEDENALILSDLHFGKTGHFRKSGIGVPQNIFKQDLQKLFSVIQFFKPSRLLIVGDLFHSHANKEMDLFLKWRNDIPAIGMHLIKGNHDILSKKFYTQASITVTDDQLLVKRFCFTHNIELRCEPENRKRYTFSGHIHPGIKLHGIGRQSLYLPCFYFGEEYAVLPAFSQFTGLSRVKNQGNDSIFAITGSEIIKMN
ncbi:MAG: ligase-associated DNA damage response endonuclease PdeM [Ginsengibacter sp.]